ncbi:hypothetical protein Rmet_6537 [Cupriavidus metallidurans CH34]|uniref:Uncharacterized protein n=1 Tax=Cupriavidus metallidurans (strain ATCC 43123 / DSM 2839 / NBRC 102507 / CH34) TaxID=266264 RepID=D3DXX4_CUPMC|nr:hypothetical protein Rmet_6537 [Cupriavidus metallidurans CH34]
MEFGGLDETVDSENFGSEFRFIHR